MDDLFQQAAEGDPDAIAALLGGQRSRLIRMIGVRLDRRLAGRIDPSDVAQEVLTRAAVQLPDYLRNPVIGFYPWLRQLAWNQLVDLHRRHVCAEKRSVLREESIGLNDQSTWELGRRLATNIAGPASSVVRHELVQRLHSAMAHLKQGEREVLILKYAEQLSSSEIAEVLNISCRTVQSRHRRALLRLNRLLDTDAS